jgi:hypothetical protein
VDKLSFADYLAIFGIVAMFALTSFDKAGKLKGPLPFILLAIAALCTLPAAFGNSWVRNAPTATLRNVRELFLLSSVFMVFSILAIWISATTVREAFFGLAPASNETNTPSEEKQLPAVEPAQPKIAETKPQQDSAELQNIKAEFIQATSPGIILFNDSSEIARDPSYSLTMWNLDKGLPSSLPTIFVAEKDKYLKSGQRMLEATLDRPEIKPLISDGNRIFGFAYVDCSNCKSSKYYWVYIVYGNDHKEECWYSEVLEGIINPNPISVSQRLQGVNWNVEEFMKISGHGVILKALPTSAFAGTK